MEHSNQNTKLIAEEWNTLSNTLKSISAVQQLS